jgi:hypothetical protein
MKKLFIIPFALMVLLTIYALTLKPPAIQAAPKAGMESLIPDSIVDIAKKSCMHCHSEPGDPMALTHLDLSNWHKYSPEKQAAKAKSMCTMVTKDKMPPKSFRKNHPEGAPSEKELNMICNWAQSIQVSKK